MKIYLIFYDIQVFLLGTYVDFSESPKAPFRMTPVIYRYFDVNFTFEAWVKLRQDEQVEIDTNGLVYEQRDLTLYDHAF